MERLVVFGRLFTSVVDDSHWYTDLARDSQMAPFFSLPWHRWRKMRTFWGFKHRS